MRHWRTLVGVAVVCACLAAFRVAAQEPVAQQKAQQVTVWIEGEDAASSTVVRHGWYSNVETDMLSGGKWLCHYSADGPATATWKFKVPAKDTYTLYLRVIFAGSTYQFSLDGAELKDLPLEAVDPQVNLTPGGAVDHRFMAWTKAGQFELDAGEHTLKLTIDGPHSHSGGVDCIALVNHDWKPAGALKPGEQPTIKVKVPSDLKPSKADAQAVAGKGEYIWIEGEDAGQNDFRKHGWYSAVKTELLSGGNFLSHWFAGRMGTAHYKFSVQQGGAYTLWLRVNVHETKLAYSLDGKPTVEVDTSKPLGRTNLVDALDVRFIGWVNAGKVELSAGEHTLSLVVHSDNNNHGMVDAIALVNFD